MSTKQAIIVLGPHGMLGQMVCSYFTRQQYLVIPVTMRFERDNKDEFIKEVTKHKDAVVINCIGKIKQKTNHTDDLLWANAILPLELKNSLAKNCLLIHPSTDCVFSGKQGTPYAFDCLPDARDAYGWSKRLGEQALLGCENAVILRVSIIGPDKVAEPKGLLGWFLSQPPKSHLKGFANHLWNGITSLEWCKNVEQRILQKPCSLALGNITQLGTKESHSKGDMLNLFQKYYGTCHNIEPINTPAPIDRRLVPQIHCKSLEEQLEELINFENQCPMH